MRLHCKSWLVIFATLFAMSLSAKKLSGWDKKRLMRIMANWDDVDSVKKILDGTVTDHWGKLIYKYDFLQDDDSLCHASYTRSKSDARAGSHSTFCRDLEQDEPDSPRSTLWDSDIFGKGNVRTSSLWKPMSPVPYWGDLLPYGRVDSLWRVNPAEIREPRKTKPRPRRPERVKSHIRRPEIVKQKTRKQKRGKSRPGKNMRMQPLSKKDKAMLKDVMSDWGGTAVKKIIRGTKLTHHGTTSYKYSFEQDDGTLCQATYARSRRKGASSDTHSVNCGSLRASHDEVFVNEPHGFWEDAGSMFRKPEKLWDHDDSMLRQIGSFLGEGDKDEDEDREPFPSLWSDDDSFFRQVNSALESKEPSFPKLRSFWDLDEKPPLKLKPTALSLSLAHHAAWPQHLYQNTLNSNAQEELYNCLRALDATYFLLRPRCKSPKLTLKDKKKLMRAMIQWPEVSSVTRIIDGSVTVRNGVRKYSFSFEKNDGSICQANYFRSEGGSRHGITCGTILGEKEENESVRSIVNPRNKRGRWRNTWKRKRSHLLFGGSPHFSEWFRPSKLHFWEDDESEFGKPLNFWNEDQNERNWNDDDFELTLPKWKFSDMSQFPRITRQRQKQLWRDIVRTIRKEKNLLNDDEDESQFESTRRGFEGY